MPMSNQNPKITIVKKPTNDPSSDNTALPIPVVSKALLAYLHEVFPDRVPTLDLSEREIWSQVGQVLVVRHLEDIFSQQKSME